MRIILAADHTGLTLKAAISEYVVTLGHEVQDMGAHEYSVGDDYPDFITPAANEVARTPGSIGIVIGGSGQGEAMAANRIPGIRAAVFYGPRKAQSALEAEGTESGDEYDIVRVERMHNNANILSLGARFISEDEALKAVELFMVTPFSKAERHIRRLSKF